MKNIVRSAVACLCVLLASLAARAQNYSDIWFNPSESGWGLTIADHQSQLFAVWFTYRQDGKPTWYVIPGGTFSNNRRHFVGDMYATTGPAYSSAPFDPSRVTVNKVGTATIDFEPSGGATFGYNLAGVTQTKAIQRQPFGTGAPAWGSDVTDIWYNAAESGWGLTLAQHGNDVFGVWFTYDTDGQPLWVVMPGVTFNGAAAFSGTLYTTTGPYFASAPFDSSRVVVTPQGNASVTLASGASGQCSGSQSGTFNTTFRGSTMQKAICHQPFGDTPTAAGDIPTPMALPPGTPKQQAAAFAGALAGATDARARTAIWLGIYQALSMPVTDEAGNSVTGTGDDLVGPPYWNVWYGAQKDLGRGVTLADAGKVLTLHADGSTEPGAGDVLLADLRNANAAADPKVQLFGAFVRERILRARSRQDILSPSTTANAVIDATTLQLVQWALARHTMAGIAKVNPSLGAAAPKAWEKAGKKRCAEVWGSEDTTKFVNFIHGKIHGGVSLPFSDQALAGLVERAMANLGASKNALSTINEKVLPSINGITTLMSFIMQINSLSADPDQAGPLVRSKTTSDGQEQVVRWHLYNEDNKTPDGNDPASCMASFVLNALGISFSFPAKEGISGAELTFEPGHNIPEKVLFNTNVPNYRITTDSNGFADQKLIGRGQSRRLPDTAKEYNDTFSMFVSGQPEEAGLASIAGLFTDSFFVGLNPLNLVAPIVDILKTLHYDLGEREFLLTDWATGYEVDFNQKDTHVFGTICNGLENPFSLDFDSGGMIKGNINFTPSSAAGGAASINGLLQGAPVAYLGNGTYDVLGTIYGDQRLKMNIPTMTATYPGPSGPITSVVGGITSTMELLVTSKCN